MIFKVDQAAGGSYLLTERRMARRVGAREEESRGLLMPRHFAEAHAVLYAAWRIREGLVYAAPADLPQLRRTLERLEVQLDRMSDGVYGRCAAAGDEGALSGVPEAAAYCEIHALVERLRAGQFRGSAGAGAQTQSAQRLARTLLDRLTELVWRLDNGGACAQLVLDRSAADLVE